MALVLRYPNDGDEQQFGRPSQSDELLAFGQDIFLAIASALLGIRPDVFPAATFFIREWRDVLVRPFVHRVEPPPNRVTEGDAAGIP